ncbi:MAG: hypothetical protein HRT47_02460 [Candidatus Caenarcaniphilales bacterium]|nr:hypothetical protein [Candidatus Caenarcaniphilales bacterium]
MSTTSINSNPDDPRLQNQGNGTNQTGAAANNATTENDLPTSTSDTTATTEETDSSFNNIEDLTAALTEDIQDGSLDFTIEDGPDTKDVDFSTTLFSEESIANDQALLGTMNEEVATLSGEDEVMNYLTEAALKYEFGDDINMDDFEVLSEELDEDSGFMFTSYGNGDQEILIFSRYDDEDKHAELGIYRDDESTTKFDYSELNKTERGVVMQHATDFYDNEDGEKEREFALIYDDKAFKGTDREDTDTGLWTTESQKIGEEQTSYSSVKFNDGTIMVQAYTPDENKVEIQITNDIGTAFMNTDETVAFTTEGQNFRDNLNDNITADADIPPGGMLYMNYDEQGNEVGYSANPDADMAVGIYENLVQVGDDSQLAALQEEFNSLVTEVGNLTTRLYDHEDGDSAILTGAPNTVTQLLLSEAMTEMITVTNQIAELGGVAGQ